MNWSPTGKLKSRKNKVGYVSPMVISSEFRMGQYLNNGHRQDPFYLDEFSRICKKGQTVLLWLLKFRSTSHDLDFTFKRWKSCMTCVSVFETFPPLIKTVFFVFSKTFGSSFFNFLFCRAFLARTTPIVCADCLTILNEPLRNAWNSKPLRNILLRDTWNDFNLNKFILHFSNRFNKTGER